MTKINPKYIGSQVGHPTAGMITIEDDESKFHLYGQLKVDVFLTESQPTLKELRKKAKDLGMENASKATREDVEAFLKEHDQAG